MFVKKEDTALYAEFQAILDQPHFASILQQQSQIATACSGGIDSLALCLLLQKWCETNQKELVALIVNHKIRASASAEAKDTARQLQNIGIRTQILQACEALADTANLQAKARLLRYRLLGDYCQQNHIKALFLAHHLQDQAETFLLRIARTSHIKGLACMHSVSHIAYENEEPLYLLRPLLRVKRQHLEKWVADSPLSPANDESNQNTNFQRIQIRQLLPHLQRVNIDAQKLSIAADNMRLAHDFAQHTAEAYLQQLQVHRLGYISTTRDLWRQAHPFLHYILLADIFCRFNPHAYPPRATALQSLAKALTETDTLRSRTLNGVLIFENSSNIIFCREPKALTNTHYNLANKQKTILWDNRFCLSLSKEYAAYTVAPLAQPQSLLQKFSDHKKYIKSIPYYIRTTLPAIYHNNELCAFPLLDLYDSESVNLGKHLHIKPSQAMLGRRPASIYHQRSSRD